MSDTLLSTDEWPYSPKFQDFADFLGLPADRDAKGVNWRYDDRTAKKIEELYTWGKSKANTDDHDQVKLVVKNLTRGLGVTWVGKSLVDRLWQYVTMEASNPHLSKKLYSEKLVEREKQTSVLNKKELDSMSKIIDKATAPIQKAIENQAREIVQQKIQQATKTAIQSALSSIK